MKVEVGSPLASIANHSTIYTTDINWFSALDNQPLAVLALDPREDSSFAFMLADE